MAVSERALPHNLEAERAVIGAVLLHNEFFPVAAAVLKASDFFRDAHRRVWEAMETLNANGVPIEFVTLTHEMTRRGDLDEAGGPAQIAAFVDGVPRATNIEHYANIVREQARFRGLIYTANKVAAMGYGAEVDPDVIIDRAVTDLLTSASSQSAVSHTAHEAALAYIVGLDKGTGPSTTVPTGLADLDEILGGGVRPGSLTVVAGRPSAGKSSLGLCICRGAARLGYHSAFLSAEMKEPELASRLVAFEARVDRGRMDGGWLSELDYARLTAALASIEHWPLRLQDTVATLTEVSAWVQRFRLEGGLSVAVVDYLQLLAAETDSTRRGGAVAAVSRGLKRLARVQNVAIVAIAALNRAPDGRKDGRPRLSDLRESGAIEYDVDQALLVYRDDDSDETRGIAEVIVAKNRNGPTGVAKLVFVEAFGGLFENLAIGS